MVEAPPLFGRAQLDQMIKNLAAEKTVNINLKINGMEDLYNVQSLMKNTGAATGITTYLQNGGTIEHAQQIANQESPPTTKLCDRTAMRLAWMK